jgi:hypothetical protein
MRKNVLLFFVLVFFVQTSLFAQKITVQARLDSTVIWIGNQAHLSFEVSQKTNEKVVMPLFSDTIVGGLELIEPAKNDTTKSPDGHLLVKQHYTVTSFKDSLIYIPPYPFILNGDTVWSNSLSLKVVQPFKVDTASNTIADIKPVFDPKFDWWGLFQIILIVLLILAILIGGYILIRKYWQKKPVFEKSEPEIILPAHVIALNQLDKIKNEKSWQQGRIKEYHTELTDVLREYIERIFNIKSMEMTSEEILNHLTSIRSAKKSAFEGLKQILQIADLVKFAKWNATPDENEMSLMNAYLFVNQTKVEEVKPTEEIKKEEQKTVEE